MRTYGCKKKPKEYNELRQRFDDIFEFDDNLKKILDVYRIYKPVWSEAGKYNWGCYVNVDGESFHISTYGETMLAYFTVKYKKQIGKKIAEICSVTGIGPNNLLLWDVRSNNNVAFLAILRRFIKAIPKFLDTDFKLHFAIVREVDMVFVKTIAVEKGDVDNY